MGQNTFIPLHRNENFQALKIAIPRTFMLMSWAFIGMVWISIINTAFTLPAKAFFAQWHSGLYVTLGMVLIPNVIGFWIAYIEASKYACLQYAPTRTRYQLVAGVVALITSAVVVFFSAMNFRDTRFDLGLIAAVAASILIILAALLVLYIGAKSLGNPRTDL